MKKWLLISALAIIAIGVANVYFGPGPEGSKETVKNLPWDIEITQEGNTRVFGIDVGATTAAQAKELWRAYPEIALFRAADGSYRLESYLGKIKLGPFEARVILNLKASQEQLAKFATNSPASDTTPTGNYKLRLSGDDFEKAMQMTIVALSYSPAVDTRPKSLKHLFGDPVDEMEINDQSRYWLYPEKGVVLLINDDDKEIFHYFPPRDYDQVVQNIEALQHAKAEIPEAQSE
jgi:hypothetical protein